MEAPSKSTTARPFESDDFQEVGVDETEFVRENWPFLQRWQGGPLKNQPKNPSDDPSDDPSNQK